MKFDSERFHQLLEKKKLLERNGKSLLHFDAEEFLELELYLLMFKDMFFWKSRREYKQSFDEFFYNMDKKMYESIDENSNFSEFKTAFPIFQQRYKIQYKKNIQEVNDFLKSQTNIQEVNDFLKSKKNIQEINDFLKSLEVPNDMQYTFFSKGEGFYNLINRINLCLNELDFEEIDAFTVMAFQKEMRAIQKVIMSITYTYEQY